MTSGLFRCIIGKGVPKMVPLRCGVVWKYGVLAFFDISNGTIDKLSLNCQPPIENHQTYTAIYEYMYNTKIKFFFDFLISNI